MTTQQALAFDAFDPENPDPRLALALEQTLDVAPEATEAMLANTYSRSRRWLHPTVRFISKLMIGVLSAFRAVFPKLGTSSRWLHNGIYWGLKTFVKPEANVLILRHFHLGTEVLGFLVANLDKDAHQPPTQGLRPRGLKDLRDDMFVEHDINLFNFIIKTNHELMEQGKDIESIPLAELNFDAVNEAVNLESLPDKWHNFLDLESAIALYTPIYQFFLTDAEFRRAVASLQFDETIATYAAKLLGTADHLHLVSNRHPLVADSRLDAARNLALHGLGTERLHRLLVRSKRRAEAERKAAGKTLQYV